jgi:predicted RNA-binding protein (virulence factor B family)
MLKIGQMNSLVAERYMEFGFYLNPVDEQVLLPNKYVPEGFKLGDRINVFVYTDSEDRPVATTITPNAMVGDFAFLTVNDVNPIGTFFDWGLEKDLLVPRSEQQRTMEVGEQHVVYLSLDEETGRVFGSTRLGRHCSKFSMGQDVGQEVELLIYGKTKLSIQAVIDEQCLGILYRNEIFSKISIGDRMTGFVSRIREDGKIDLTLKKPGYQSVAGSTDSVVEILKQAGGFVACHDKSSPEEIKALFSMSKKEFKRTVGGLYKNGIIEMDAKGIRLKEV